MALLLLLLFQKTVQCFYALHSLYYQLSYMICDYQVLSYMICDYQLLSYVIYDYQLLSYMICDYQQHDSYIHRQEKQWYYSSA